MAKGIWVEEPGRRIRNPANPDEIGGTGGARGRGGDGVERLREDDVAEEWNGGGLRGREKEREVGGGK